MWVKVDDALPDHPKVLEAGLHLGSSGVGRVLAIWLKAMCYCNHNLTDGFIPERVLKSWKVCDRRPLDVAFVMVQAGIFDRESHGYRFHDYTDYQPSKADVTAKRKKDLERKRRKPVEVDSAQTPAGFHAESAALPATPSRPGLSIGTHTEDPAALRARNCGNPVDAPDVLNAMVWAEVRAAVEDQGLAVIRDSKDVYNRIRDLADRSSPPIAYTQSQFDDAFSTALVVCEMELQRGQFRRRA